MYAALRSLIYSQYLLVIRFSYSFSIRIGSTLCRALWRRRRRWRRLVIVTARAIKIKTFFCVRLFLLILIFIDLLFSLLAAVSLPFPFSFSIALPFFLFSLLFVPCAGLCVCECVCVCVRLVCRLRRYLISFLDLPFWIHFIELLILSPCTNTRAHAYAHTGRRT